MIRIYGITYGFTKTDFVPYHNTVKEKLWRFEYNPMLAIVPGMISDMADNDFLGIVSWKFSQKTGFSKHQAIAVCDGEYGKDTQLINFSPNLGKPIASYKTFMDWSAAGHGETLRYLIIMCCERLGWKYHNDPEHIIYANQFVARVDVYREYMECITKLLEYLESELWWLVNTDAAYTAGVRQNHLKANTGLNFYNYLPFVLERMTMQFVVNRNIKTVSV